MSVRGIKGETFNVNGCEKIDADIEGDFGRQQIKNAVTSINVKFPKQTVTQNLIADLKIPEEINVRPYFDGQVEILIGQDNWRLLSVRTTLPTARYDVALSKSSFGWVLHGPIYRKSSSPHNVFSVQQADVVEDENLDALVRHYFEREGEGVVSQKTPKSKHDRARKILDDSSHFMGDHWETGLLWQSDEVPNIDSYPTALRRLQLLERRLDRDPEYARLYYSEMQRFISNGYAAKTVGDIQRERIWYLPHFGVTNANKPGKVRLVFDAAAKTRGVSFNDQLDAGPDLLQSLPGVLIRFRQHKIALKADITDMFLRVKVREIDRGVQRFLWRGTERDALPDIYEMNSLIFGSKSSPCSAIYIKDRNACTFKINDSQAHLYIKSNSYMDDFLASCASIESAKKLATDVAKINAMGGFNMHGWASSHRNALPGHLASPEPNKKQTSLGDSENERVLGLVWDMANDLLKFNVDFKKIPSLLMEGTRKPTKREVLRVAMSIFDPLGLLAPFTLKSKLLLQNIWRSGVGWDNKIRAEEEEQWKTWLKDLASIKKCCVPRCLSLPGFLPDQVQIHVFCDASLSAHATVIYLRFVDLRGNILVSFLMSKSRIAAKNTTVPRLELQAALLGSQLAKYVQDESDFKISRRVLWSDSTTVLTWLRSGTSTKGIYVTRRLADIADLTGVAEWRWVPSKENPADDATRFSKEELSKNNRWFKGPSFLYLPESEWPQEKVLTDKEKDTVNKLETRKEFINLVLTTPDTIPFSCKILGWPGMLVHARRIIRAAEKWRKVCPKTSNLNERCENFLYRQVQNECFSNEIEALNKREYIKGDSKIATFKPFLDKEGVLRADGRVKTTLSGEFANQPIILDAKHYVTQTLIKEYHRSFFHGSNNTVLNEIRQKFHIVGLRKSLRTLASRCLVCRVQRAKPFNPMMAGIPLSRIAYRLRPFSHCGLDYFGPIFVTIGRRREKRWGALFTCLTTRAVHIEIAHSLSADSAINAIRRLVARRGKPIRIYSDNASNFHKAEKDLKEAVGEIDRLKLEKYTTKKYIKWTYNPPDAPHFGGAWERLVRSVKTALYVVLKEQAPREEVLATMLAEIEHSINSRPLTHVSLDIRDGEALTPNHFLIGTSSAEIDLGRYDPKLVCPKKQWRIAQKFSDEFWKRWLREYLPTLLPRQKWTKEDDPIRVGDIVLIMDLQAPRNNWRKGKVVKIFPSQDQQVRVAEVQTSTGKYQRPTRKLIKLLGANEA